VASVVVVALVGTLAVFVIQVPEALHWYRADARMLFDGELGDRIGGNVDGFIWVLVGIPLLGLPFGVIGAALGARSRHRRARQLPDPDGHPHQA